LGVALSNALSLCKWRADGRRALMPGRVTHANKHAARHEVTNAGV